MHIHTYTILYIYIFIYTHMHTYTLHSIHTYTHKLHYTYTHTLHTICTIYYTTHIGTIHRPLYPTHIHIHNTRTHIDITHYVQHTHTGYRIDRNHNDN